MCIFSVKDEYFVCLFISLSLSGSQHMNICQLYYRHTSVFFFILLCLCVCVTSSLLRLVLKGNLNLLQGVVVGDGLSQKELVENPVFCFQEYVVTTRDRYGDYQAINHTTINQLTLKLPSDGDYNYTVTALATDGQIIGMSHIFQFDCKPLL